MLKRALLLVISFVCASYLYALTSLQTASCLKCHNEKNIHTSQIKEWKGSAHAKAGVGCFECHQAKKGEADAYEHYKTTIATIVSPFDCARCHKQEFAEFDRSHHAKAGEILNSLDNYLGEVVEGPGASIQGCQYCHGSIVKVNEKGKLDPKTWPNLGIGRLNPDGSKGSCSACHAKHDFSMKVARDPDACGKCHLGPDHPQREIYQESKHGIIFTAHKEDMKLGKKSWILGHDYTKAPNCVTCHMGATKFNHRTHDLGERISMALRPPVSKVLENSEEKKKEMQKVCSNCHGPEWYTNFYSQFYGSVALYDNVYGRPSAEIMKKLLDSGKLTKQPFDEDLEWTYYELWHHEGRRARHGAAMMGPDYVQWHGFYEVAKHFYFKFLPEVRKAGGGVLVDELLKKPEHLWIKGIKPEGLKMQEAAFKQWAKMREEAIAKRASK